MKIDTYKVHKDGKVEVIPIRVLSVTKRNVLVRMFSIKHWKVVYEYEGKIDVKNCWLGLEENSVISNVQCLKYSLLDTHLKFTNRCFIREDKIFNKIMKNENKKGSKK